MLGEASFTKSASAFRSIEWCKKQQIASNNGPGGIYTIGAMHPALTENDPEGSTAQTNFSVAVLTSSRQAVFGDGGAREPVTRLYMECVSVPFRK